MCCAPCNDGEHATVENGVCQCCGTGSMSRAAIVPGHSADRIRAYMPSNYEVVDYEHNPGSRRTDDRGVLIIGHDDAGWTLEDYVLPRLASGLYFARIIGEFSMEDYPSYDLNDPADAAIIVGDLDS